MLKFLVSFFKSLNSNSHPGEIAHAIALGVMLGFLPKTNLLWYVLFILILFIRINKGTFLLFTLVASIIAPMLDPFFDSLGYKILMIDSFVPYYEKFLTVPFVPLTKFNNTIVMGSFVSGIVLYIPIYVFALIIIMLWRKYVHSVFINSPLVKAFYKIPLIAKIQYISSEL